MSDNNLLRLFGLEKIELFDWTSDDKLTKIRFNVTEIEAAIERGDIAAERIYTEVSVKVAATWLVDRELDIEYAINLSPSALDRPCLGVVFPDDEVLTINGSHRYFAHAHYRIKEISFLLVKYADIGAYMKLEGKAL